MGAWPITNQDYDMYLFDSNLSSVGESIAPQTGTETPTESLSYKVPIDGRGDYYLFIIKIVPRRTMNFHYTVEVMNLRIVRLKQYQAVY